MVGTQWSMKKKVVLVIGLAVFLPLVTIVPGLFWQLHEADSCLRNFGDELARKDYAAAYRETSPELRSVTDFTHFVSINQTLVVRTGGLESVHVSSSSVRRREGTWWATADVEVIFNRGSLPFTFILKKQDQGWQIYSYQEQ